MADRFFRTIVTLENDSLLIRDGAVNVFHFRSNGADTETADATAINGMLSTFYTTIQGLYSQALTGNVRCRTYNLEAQEPRLPIVDTTTAKSFVGAAMPNEVALCLSFQGAITSGVNRRRNRGRVYIGPLAASVAVQATGDMVVTSAARTTLTGAANTMKGPTSFGVGGGILNWSVFSRAEAGAPAGINNAYTNAQLQSAYRSVATGWVDNGFDTQRRRGLNATARTTF